ncbi:MAG: uncharacterized protein KVP18_004135 [Porospora cf. gigantea A]|uniref:uncharacterized protein n=2 Tax=Porospora cf. gigantea A TaxID=2853593 RepID=UPI00355ABEB2|nr:MAG: hypothetical protein KVP18_004135 [Porospora cf. gigantea A]
MFCFVSNLSINLYELTPSSNKRQNMLLWSFLIFHALAEIHYGSSARVLNAAAGCALYHNPNVQVQSGNELFQSMLLCGQQTKDLDAGGEFLVKPYQDAGEISTSTKTKPTRNVGHRVRCGDLVTLESARIDRLFIEYTGRQSPTRAGGGLAGVSAPTANGVFRLDCAGKFLTESSPVKLENVKTGKLLTSSTGRVVAASHFDTYLSAEKKGSWFGQSSEQHWTLQEHMHVRPDGYDFEDADDEHNEL